MPAHMRIIRITAAALLLLAAPVGAEQTLAPSSEPTAIAAIKINITKTGRIFVNDQESSFEGLKMKLIRLKEKNGMVFYYREDPEKEPPAMATEVIKLIIENKLPVRICRLPDCSQ